MNYTNITYDLRIKTITPIHIGAGPEKKWIKGLDYCLNNEHIEFFKLNHIDIDENDIEKITSLFLSHNQNRNTIKEISKKLKIKPAFKIKFNKEPNEIFAHIRDGFNVPYIPGSSIKGALRSAILGYLCRKDEDINRNPFDSDDPDTIIFGTVENSIMRFLQVTDAHFTNEAMALYDTKIYSLDYNNQGAWKHNRKGSDENFNSTAFVSTYECININKQSKLRLNITAQIIKLLNDQKPIFTEKIIELSLNTHTTLLEKIFKMINEQTKLYLEKEIKFFAHHKGDKYDIILKQYYSLKNIVEHFIENKNKQALLHLGSGSGFHGITGDWQFDTHIINGIERNSNRGLINEKPAAKTRKLIFRQDNDEFVFTPFGFIAISINNSFDHKPTFFEQSYYFENFSKSETKSISQKGNFTTKSNEETNTNNEDIIEYMNYLINTPTIKHLHEIQIGKFVYAEIIKIEKTNSLASVTLDNKTLQCQIFGKLLKKLKPGDKIKAKITNCKNNEIISLSTNLF
ncbi:MAG: hypothetical protein KatS3mg034_2085 [Vicingaceae bacterium]|nr:MAG: hypothetical protein KatS3mg034_2085 [Vicingaceae bacterium]